MFNPDLFIKHGRELIEDSLGFNLNHSIITLLGYSDIRLCNTNFTAFKFNIELYEIVDIEIELYYKILDEQASIYLNTDKNFKSDLHDIRNQYLNKFDELTEDEKLRYQLLFIDQMHLYHGIEIKMISEYIIKLLVKKLDSK